MAAERVSENLIGGVHSNWLRQSTVCWPEILLRSSRNALDQGKGLESRTGKRPVGGGAKIGSLWNVSENKI